MRAPPDQPASRPPTSFSHASAPVAASPRYYRGTVPGDPRRITTGDAVWDGWLFVTDTPDGARCYGPAIEEILLRPDARVLREGSAAFRQLAGPPRPGQTLLAWASAAAVRARAAGYDAIHFAR